MNGESENGGYQRKRNCDNCDAHSEKRFKSFPDYHDSPSSDSSPLTTSSSSPCDSGFRETVIRNTSTDKRTPAELVCKSNKKLSNRIRTLEQKVSSVGKELQLIRQILEFVSRLFSPDAISQAFLKLKDEDNAKNGCSEDANLNSCKFCSLRDLPTLDQQFYDGDRKGIVKEENLSSFLTESRKKTTGNSSTESSVQSQEIQAQEGLKSSESSWQNSTNGSPGTSSNEESNNGTNSTPLTLSGKCKKAADLRSILPETFSAVDIIHLWEYGTTDVLPIKIWNKEELMKAGQRISIWQQIITLFKEECNSNLKTFVCKYSGTNGDVMSVPEIIARSKLGRKSSSNSVSENYQRAKEMTASNSSEQNDYSITTGEASNERNCELLPPLYVLPRKLNGSKVSAKDVIRIWENGQGRIPPVRSWLPSQKVRQQSKISRWGKIVDIFNNECNGDMKTFEARYSNKSGGVLPIAAIISKYEQKQSAEIDLYQPILSRCSSFVEAQRPTNAFRPIINAAGLRQETPIIVSHTSASTAEAISAKTSMPGGKNILFDNSIWKKWIDSYSKEEFCREYINSQAIENCVAEAQPTTVNKDDVVSNEVSVVQMAKSPIKSILNEQREEGQQEQQQKHSSLAAPVIAEANGHTHSSDQLLPKYFTSLPVSSICTDGSVSVVKPVGKKVTNITDYANSNPVDKTMPGEQQQIEFPDTTDPFEVISMWENGYYTCPPIRVMDRGAIESNPKLSLWTNFMDLFFLHCHADKDVLLQKFSDGEGRLMSVNAIVQKYQNEQGQLKHQQGNHLNQPRQHPLAKAASHSRVVRCHSANQSSNVGQFKNGSTGNIYTLPRKINGHKVSAKDIIHIWYRGYKNIPPVGTWLPWQKVRQQSKISRWKKIVEIFETDCNGDMQIFEAKYLNKANEMLPVATIIARYEQKKDDTMTISSTASGTLSSYTI
eukprot:gene5565-6253_t